MIRGKGTTLIVAAMLATAWAGGCGDDSDKKTGDAGAANPAASGVAAKPAAAAAADATPKQAAVEWATALTSGDATTARTLMTGTEEQMKMMDGMVGFMGAAKNMRDAMKEKFGDDAVKQAGGAATGMDPEEMKQKIDESTEKIEGDTASLTVKGEEQPLVLKKQDGRWKIDLNGPAMAEMQQASAMMAPMQKAMDETTAEIKAGKYKTVQEAQMAMGKKMFGGAAGIEAPA